MVGIDTIILQLLHHGWQMMHAVLLFFICKEQQGSDQTNELEQHGSQHLSKKEHQGSDQTHQVEQHCSQHLSFRDCFFFIKRCFIESRHFIGETKGIVLLHFSFGAGTQNLSVMMDFFLYLMHCDIGAICIDALREEYVYCMSTLSCFFNGV